ncbi:MAG: hypothetical protein K2H53_07005 [Clostridia bacterium]|nr:hypothetical protein [Clostridia bacterium]
MEINLDKLLEIPTGRPKYKEISKFPSIKKDIALVVDKSIQSEQIAKTIKKASGSNLSNIEVFDVYEGVGVGEGKKSIAYSLTFGVADRTLTDEEINPLLEKIVEMTGKEFGATLRG